MSTPSYLTVSLLVGTDAADEATVHVHAGNSGEPLGVVRFAFAGAYLSLQAGPDDGGPAVLADLLDTLAARVRDEHARYLAQQEGEPQ